ncbi:probable G-protein coupled receptor 139 [Heptranchias perlo]|uniref:probable G-protein coupled receptor 139 n=1 Tax=Heptranchias perlo TaxID=212740 RepID=UPI00355AA7F9
MELPPILQIAFSYYHVLAVFGLPANLLTIVILYRANCGLSKGVTFYLLGMTTVDLLVIVSNVMVYYILYYYFPFSFLNYTAVRRLNEVINYAAIDCSVWFTVTFTFDRFVAICCQKLKAKYCTERTAVLVTVTVCVVFSLKNVPLYFAFEPVSIMNHVEWGAEIKPSYHMLPCWLAFDWLDTVLCPLAPYLLILFFNALTIRHILMVSRIRRGFQGHRTCGNDSDPEMQSRRKSIILLFAISGTFIVLWMPYVLFFLLSRITFNHYNPSDYTDPFLIAEYTGDMFQLLSSCTNTCIYALAQTKFRKELSNAIKYPFTLVVNLVK